MNRVAVVLESTSLERRNLAESISMELACPLIDASAETDAPAELLLVVRDPRIELRDCTQPRSSPIFADFADAETKRRLGAHSASTDPLLRAVDPHRERPTVIDATAGFGSDAFVLAMHGCEVRALERSAIMALLLQDGLQRARKSSAAIIREAADRVNVQHVDSRIYLSDLMERDWPDVVYLDPMYPARRRKVAVKKELDVCRRIVGDDEDADGLLKLARNVAHQRVVVKRQRHSPPLAPDVHHVIRSKLARFDVYSPNR